MLFNCFNCGKSISSKKDICVYCTTDVSHFTIELKQQKRLDPALKEKYSGSLLSFLLKTKVH